MRGERGAKGRGRAGRRGREGQGDARARMGGGGRGCSDVVTRMSAADSGLRDVAMRRLDDHLDHCVRSAAAEGGTVADEKLHEASEAIARLVRA